MGKRQQIRRQIAKNPKAWYKYQKSDLNPTVYYYQYPEPILTKKGWEPGLSFNYRHAYRSLIQRALIDCGELTYVYFTARATKSSWRARGASQTYHVDELYDKRYRLLIPSGEIANLGNIIRSSNESVLKRITDQKAQRAKVYGRLK